MAALLVLGCIVFVFTVVLFLPEPGFITNKQREEFLEIEALRERLLRGELGDF